MLEPYLELALEAALEAGRLTLGYFQRRHLPVEYKADTSPVTLADRQAEELIRQMIRRRYPEHGLVGEELGELPSGSALSWVIDPIDGTKSFIHGVPLYGVLVALVEEGYPLVGVMHFPALKETVYAAREMGCFLNGRRLQLREEVPLKEATLLTSGLETFWKYPEKRARFEALSERVRVVRTWGDAYGYALVASGKAHIMVDPELSVWDAAPLQVVMEEAGGRFTDWRGEPTLTGGDGLAAAPSLHEEVLTLLMA